MAGSPLDEPAGSRASPRQRRQSLPPELIELLRPTLQVGAGAGAAGLFVGATAGILRSTTPVLFALVSGAQCFTLGSTYYATRHLVTQSWGGDSQLAPSRKTQASAIAGGVAGAVGGLLRSRSNVLPGLLVCSLLGAGGQSLANSWMSRAAPSKTNWLDSKWSPVTVLTDQQYERMLEEKILGFEADIALIDDKIRALRAAQLESGRMDGTHEISEKKQ